MVKTGKIQPSFVVNGSVLWADIDYSGTTVVVDMQVEIMWCCMVIFMKIQVHDKQH